MKKFLLLLALAFAVLPAASQSKLDLLSKAQLRTKRLELAKMSDSQFSQKMKALKRGLGVPNSNMLAIIRLNDGYTEQDLQNEGVTVLRSSHGFAFVAVPAEQVEKVSQLKCVRHMQLSRTLTPKLNNARALTGVDKIHQGLNLTQAYTGKGVIAGIVDGGIDPNHINFQDADGNSRINHFEYLTIDPNATSTDKCVIRKVYDATTINKFTTDDNSSFHGTHTMGIMAGGYRGELNVAEADASTGLAPISSMANPYYGVAYESEIAAACGELYDIVIATGVEDILMYADKENKPSVINLSLGSNTGTHDGTGVINQFFDALAEDYNAIICVSAGNEGDMNIACNKTFTSTDTELKTFIEGYNAEINSETRYARAGSVEIYSNDNTPVTEITCVIYNSARGRIAKYLSMTIDETTEGTGKYWVSSADYQESSTDIIDQTLGQYFEGFIGLGWSYDEYSNRFCAVVDYTLINSESNASGKYKVGFVVKGTEGQRVDTYCDGQFSYFSNNDIEGWDDGMNNGSISDLATGKSLLVVGSYNSASEWGALDGLMYRASYNTPVNEATSFSSYGTLIDGRNLPHVLAPGAVIISSMSHYYENAGYADEAATSAVVPNTTRKDSFGWAMGTSMASPHVAGAIALWLEADPDLTLNDVKDIIAQTAHKDQYTDLEPDQVKVGAGKFDAYEGLKEVIRRKEAGIGSVNADDNRLVVQPTGERSFKVFLADAKNINTTVYTTMGACVLQQHAEGNEDTINLEALTPGYYVVNVNGRHSKCIVVK